MYPPISLPFVFAPNTTHAMLTRGSALLFVHPISTITTAPTPHHPPLMIYTLRGADTCPHHTTEGLSVPSSLGVRWV